MKLSTLIAISCFTFMCTCLSQASPTIDSLRSELKNVEDTTRIKLLLDLTGKLKFDSPQEALEFANSALEESLKSNYKKGEAESYNNLGIIHAIRNNYTSALSYFISALKIHEEIGDVKGTGNTLNNIANINNLQKDTIEALKYYEKALEIKSSLPDKSMEISGLNSLGLAYTDFGHYEKARETFNKMVALGRVHERQDWLAKAYNQLGRNANLSGNYKAALDYYEKAVLENQLINRKKGEAIATSNLGEVYKNMNEHVQAITYFEKSLAIRREINYTYGECITLLKIAKSCQALGRYQLSNTYAKQSLELAKSLGVREFSRDALECLANNYQSQGNYQQAFKYQNLLMAERDSILNEEKIKQMSELRAQFDLDIKERQIASQQATIGTLEQKNLADRNLRFALVAVVVLLIVLIAIVLSRYRLKQRAGKILQHKNEEINAKNQEIEDINDELEKRMLRAQMDPHFIFNSLNSIQHFITINDKESAIRYLSKFSKLIRQVLDNSVNQQVPIADEIKLLEYYIQLEALRFDHKFDYAINIDKSLDIYDDEIPFLLIQPYVENSIIHGIRHKKEKGKLSVDLQKRDAYILCTVEDNGVGRGHAETVNKKRPTHASHGMPITSKRLELLNKGKHKKTLVSVTDLFDEHQNAKGTKVEIQIPVEEI